MMNTFVTYIANNRLSHFVICLTYNGTGITYDAVGNPLSYYNGFSFTWVGRQMQTVSKNALKAKTTE